MSVLSLGDIAIGAADTYETDWVLLGGGVGSLTLSSRLAYGSGGETVIVVIETSLNQGQTSIPIARFDFDTEGLEKVVNLSATTPITSPLSVEALDAEGTNDGIIGDRLRAVVESAGTYAGSTVISVRAVTH